MAKTNLFKNKKLLFFIFVVIAILILDNHYGWSSTLGDLSNLKNIRESVSLHYWQAVALYFVVSIVGCVLLAIPGITFAVFAGFMFGAVEATVYSLIATTIGASLAFLLGRFFLKKSIEPLVKKNKYMNRLLFDENTEGALILLMITRVIPIFPYNIQNFAYGITNMSFWKYTLYTLIFMAPGVAFVTIGVAGIGAGSNRWLYFLVAGIIGFGVLVGGIYLWYKYLYPILKDEKQK